MVPLCLEAKMEPLLLTEGDVGNLLNVSRSTVRKLMADERLKFCHVGRSLRFHRKDVEATAEALRRVCADIADAGFSGIGYGLAGISDGTVEQPVMLSSIHNIALHAGIPR